MATHLRSRRLAKARTLFPATSQLLLLVVLPVLLVFLVLLVCALASAPAQASGPQPADAATATGGQPQPSAGTPPAAVRRAWQRAKDVGVYHFATELKQTTYPAPAVANIGRSPLVDELHLEGDMDLPQESVYMSLWQDGNVTGAPKAEMRVENGRGYLRQPDGSWQEELDAATGLGAGADPLAYLSSIKNVVELGTETRALPAPGSTGADAAAEPSLIVLSRYGFDFDGPAFAVYMRDQLERQLTERGELPLGVSLDTAREYRGMTGQGELWVDGRGLPLRLTVHLAYPQGKGGQRIEADVKTDFSGYAAPALSAPTLQQDPLAWAGASLRLPSLSGHDWQGIAVRSACLAAMLGLAGLVIVGRRSRRVYGGVTLAVIFSMVVLPVPQAAHTGAFYERMTAQQAQEQATQQAQQDARAYVAEQTGSSWDPHRDALAGPLVAPAAQPSRADRLLTPRLAEATPTPAPGRCDSATEADSDNDGLSNKLECAIGSDQNAADTDGDLLTDGQEVLRVGTDPTLKESDSDGDGISDYVEVAGFDYAGQHWYTNALNADTNNDGRLDSEECRLLTGVKTPPVVTQAECDKDNDGKLDLFENDDDNDGVPDRVDVSPTGVLGRNGQTARPDGSYFDAANPLKLSVQGLADDRPAFVDFQLRPITATHLTYALNVLDWPAQDADGQLQHYRNSTFANTANLEIRNTSDAAAANGDIRLIPMMEIEIDGATVPLKLAPLPEVTVAVGADSTVSTTVTLRKATATTVSLNIAFGGAGSYTVRLHAGSCDVAGAPLQSFTSSTGSMAGTMTNLADGDHSLRVTSGSVTKCAALPNLVNGPYTDSVIDMSVLQPYGIGVREVSTDSTRLLAYVPLNVVPDDTGGGRSAFTARMLYWPGATNAWEMPQTVRAIWAVQMLSDDCDSAKAAEGEDMTSFCADPANRTPDDIRIVQMYPESWYVTGLAVREDHGLDTAIIYENAAKPTADLQYQDALWMLSLGLGSSFVTGRDCENALNDGDDYVPSQGTCRSDTLTDLSVFITDTAGITAANTTIAGRWGYPNNTQATDEQRLAIPVDELLVRNFRDPHQDYRSVIAMTITESILNSFPSTSTPMLMFAQTERYRTAGLDSLQGTRTVTMTLNTPENQEQTLNTLKWVPYRKTNGKWEVYPAEQYWDKLEMDLRARFMQIYPNDGEEAAIGRMMVGRSYYVSMMQGVAGSCTEKPCAVEGKHDSPKDLINATKLVISKGMVSAVKLSILAIKDLSTHTYHPNLYNDEFKNNEFVDQDLTITEFRLTAGSIAEGIFGPWGSLLSDSKSLFTGALIGAGVVVAGAVVAIALTFTQLAEPLQGAVHIAARVLLALNVVLQTLCVVHTIAKLVKGAMKLGAAWSAIKATGMTQLKLNFGKSASKLAVVGLIIGLIVTWGAWLASAIVSNTWKSIAFTSSIAGAIGATLGIIFVFVVLAALGPIGALIGAIMGLIDAMVAMLCNAFLTPEQQAGQWGQWLCGGISGFINKLFSWLIYSGTVMVDMDPPEEKGAPWYPRLNLGNFNSADLVDPNSGFVAGNAIKYFVNVTNTIDLVDPPVSFLEEFYYWQFDDKRLASSNFKYRWQNSESSFEDEVQRKGMEEPWDKTNGSERPFYHVWDVRSEDGVSLPPAGINQPVTLYLSEAYAIPAQECWGVLFLAVCYIRSEKSTQHYDIGQNLTYDVLPATIDGFYSLARKGNGYALSWGQTGTLTFPTLLDADGDGMIATADPDDSKWDTDNDGLSDGYERGIGSNPAVPDTDGDSLPDAEEVRLGTNPSVRDSDGDGLPDADEVAGWSIVVAVGTDKLFTTHVSSDPRNVDADGDTLTDFQEKLYGFNPHVANNPQVLKLDSEISEVAGGVYTPTDNLVKPGAALHYTATVTNRLDNRTAEGLLSTEASAVLQNQGAPQSFVLDPEQHKTMVGDLNVGPATASGVYSLTQVAAAEITDWSELSGGATLWLPFDDPVTTTTWMDSSGNRPAHNATCRGTGCTTAAQGGRYGSALSLPAGTGYARVEIGLNPAAYGVSFWTKSASTQSQAALFSANGGYGLQITSDNGVPCSRTAFENPPGGGRYTLISTCATGRNVRDGNWHHIVHTYDPAHGFELYVDGARYPMTGYGGVGGPQLSTSLNIGGSEAGTPSLIGLIDDVRLFSHRLTEPEIQTLMSEPIVRLSFNSPTVWTDSSIFHAPVSCTAPYCPEHDPAGMMSGGAAFDLRDSLTVGGAGSAQLDLSGGHFSIAAWLYPKTGCTTDAFPQLILGDAASLPNYPSLLRIGDSIDYRFTSGTTLHDAQTPTGTLTANTWQHVLATFDTDDRGGAWKIYINGALKWEDATTFATFRPKPGSAFTVGTSSISVKTFCGSVDELEIFNRTLGPDDVQDLVISSATALHLPLDEPPGAKIFQDMSLSAQQASCSGSSCPTAGVVGRAGRAAWFTSAAQNRLTLPNSVVNQIGNRLTVSAWIKPSSLSGIQRIVASARTVTVNGWGFGTYGTSLVFSTFGVKEDYIFAAGLQPNRWYHVAAVLDQNNAVSFYVNGKFKATVSGPRAANADLDDDLLVGATTSPGSSAPSELFDGQIDDLWIFGWPVQSAGMARIAAQAPVMNLRFDDARTATSFVDDAHPDSYATCAAGQCPLTGEGVRGQLGLAAQFDGWNDVVTLAHNTELAPAAYSVGAWVKPNDSRIAPQELIGKWELVSKGYAEYKYRLALAPGSLQVMFLGGCAQSPYAATSAAPLVKNSWNHVMGTYDGTTLRLYINGSLSASQATPDVTCLGGAPVRIGGYDGKLSTTFDGQMDNVVLYNRVLSPADIHAQFVSEAGWVQDRQGRNLTVDGDVPVVQLMVPGVISGGQMYLANQPVQLGVTAVDTTTGVAAVYLGTKTGSNPYTWTAAPRCADVTETSTWCPTFTPAGASSYTLIAKAEDKLGNSGLSAAQTVFIDSAPPTVTLTVAQNNQVIATHDTTHPDQWLVPLQGTVSDPSAGSGIAADGLRVTMRKPNGDLAGVDGQVGTISGNTWSIQYAIVDRNPTQAYSVTVQVRDRIGQTPGLSEQQLLLHSATVVRHVTVHAKPPAGFTDRGQLPSASSMLETAPTLRGIITTRPVPVVVDWATGANGASEALSIDCTAPVASVLYAAAAGSLAASASYSWSGDAHRDSSCRVTLPVTSGSGDLTGTVKVCGAQVAAWSGAYSSGRTVPFTAAASACPADLPDAGIGGADLAFTPNLPGSAFINEAPPAGLALHLPFEDGPDQQGNLSLRDVSGRGNTGTCSGSSCPSSGLVGHVGNAVLFDGVDDSVSVGSGINVANGSFSASFWAKPEQTNVPQAVIGQGINKTNYGLFIGFAYDGKFTCGFWGNDLVAPTAADSNWHHWTCTYDAATRSRTIYRDGVQVAQGTATSNYLGLGVMYVGTFPGVANAYKGLLDEVRIYSRTLAAADVKTLYLGSEPVLALPLDETWATNGTLFPDSSGWQRQATLSTGANDRANKAIAGRVGPYAVHLDGSDDYIRVGDVDEADAFGDFTISQWFSLDALGAISASKDFASPVSKGLFSGNGWAVLVNRDSGSTANHEVRLYLNGALVAMILAPAGGWQVGQWYHYAFTRSGTALKTYLNGADKGSFTNATVPAANSSSVLLGKNETVYPWQGGLDDLRIYRRSLAPAELQALYLSGWQAATLGQSGATVQATQWQRQAPDGLEGSFKVNLRTSDTAGHRELVLDRDALWTGSLDTLAPRLTLYKTASGASYRYTTLATDFNLVSDGFSSPCGSSSAQTFFQSPWYVALASSTPKLYQLSADCTLPAGSVVEQATARDSFGNQTVVGVTAGAPPDEVLERPELQRWQALHNPALALAADETPLISFVPNVLTTAAYYELRTVDVTGLITGSQGVAALDVAIGGSSGPAQLSLPDAQWPYTMTWRFPWRLLGRGALPDGGGYTAVATATTGAGQTFTATGALTLDVAPPAEVTLSLTSGGAPLAAGSTLRTPGAALELAWTASGDGAGLNPYVAQWTAQAGAGISTVITTYDPAGPLASAYTAGEAQRLAAQVGAQDTNGNLRWQTLGPIYVDGPQTPDYIEMGGPAGRAYDGWLDSGCSLLAVDRRGEQITGGRATQRLYATWDQQALRLAWTGANWNTDGDLYVYLDTAAGGTDQVFFPYPPAGTVISLPPGMGADALIWVRDSRNAALLRWDATSGAWGSPETLAGSQFRFDSSRRSGQTDLYLPFELLGLAGSSGLGLVAFAAEEAAPDAGLQIWATAPSFNPANSPRANPLAAHIPQGAQGSLAHLYRWPSLSSSICPNGSDGSQPGAYFADTNPRITISPDPLGGAVAGTAGGVFWLGDSDALQAELLHLLQAAYPAVGDGQEIVYTIRYRNRGTQTAPGVRVELAAFGALRLLDAAAELGDVLPGTEATATFRAVADQSLADTTLAAVRGLVFDATHTSAGPALDRLWAVHHLDAGAPNVLAIESPIDVVGTGQTLVSGSAHDESGVTGVQVEVQTPLGGTSLLSCTVSSRTDGRWSCPWDVTASNGGVAPSDKAQLTLRVQASDPFGHSAWGAAQTLIVDAQPPTVTVNLDGIKVYPGNVVHKQGGLTGQADDEHGVAGVEVCGDGECRAAVLKPSGSGATRWSILRQSNELEDHVAHTIGVYAVDSLGNRTLQPLSFSVYLDDVAPAITVTEAITQAPLGSKQTVLSGTVSDGGTVTGMWVHAVAPDGQQSRSAVARDGDGWSFELPADLPGPYVLLVQAVDGAENSSTSGPYTVDVTCTDAGPLATSLLAEPAASSPFSLTLSAMIGNRGPAALPAGMPVAIFAGQQMLWQATTGEPLAPGAQQAISVLWPVDSPGDYDISIVLNSPAAAPGDAPALTLCQAPASLQQVVGVRDLPLDPGWNLVGPPVAPLNNHVQVVQRPISSDYRLILGYDGGNNGGFTSYDPGAPAGANSLHTVNAGRGYWIDVLPGSGETPAATLRLAGDLPAEDQPLPLAAGWNLAGYLARRALPVPDALRSIDGQYTSVLGFDGTALSYYPDLGPTYNTLETMASAAGYWIRAAQAITLQYPVGPVTPTVPITPGERAAQIRQAEQAAGVAPTYQWVNMYGRANLPDGSGAPVGTVVLAVDPQGVICGATVVAYAGHYGLLACYADDPATARDEGGLPGDAIRLFISADSVQPTRQIGAATWTAHGDRHLAPAQQWFFPFIYR